MKVMDMRLEEIIPYHANPRHNEKAVEAVANSIREFGFKQPIVVDVNNVIIVGHTRYKAARELGLETVPVLVAEDLDEEKVRAYRLADNKTAELAEWDDSLLEQELGAIEGLDMGDFGFSVGDVKVDIDAKLEEVEEDGYDPEEPAPTRCKPGEIWQLGDHRLMCGDSTDEAQVARLMGGELADMLLTDPPYNVNYTGGTKDALTIENDNMDSESFRAFLAEAFHAAAENMRPGAGFYIWHADSERVNFHTAAEATIGQVRQTLIWAKNTFVLGRQDYQWQHEPYLYGWKDGAAHWFVDDRRRSTVIEDARPDIEHMKAAEMRELLEEIYADGISGTIIREDKPTRSAEHPTMKPVKLMARQVLNSSQEGEIVLDVFGGSGSTLMACEQLGRRCFTMELDPKFCDVIIDRWERYAGREAVKAVE